MKTLRSFTADLREQRLKRDYLALVTQPGQRHRRTDMRFGSETKLGFSSIQHFIGSFRTAVGVSPGEWRQKQAEGAKDTPEKLPFTDL